MNTLIDVIVLTFWDDFNWKITQIIKLVEPKQTIDDYVLTQI